MSDKREKILDDNWESGLVPNDYPDSIIIKRQEVYNAMDEHGKRMSICFLKYVLEKMGGHSVDAAGNVEIKWKGEWLTPEQLFENFL